MTLTNNRTAAAKALVPILVRSLSDSDPRIREAGAEALGAVPEQGGDIHAALPVLAASLSDPERRTRTVSDGTEPKTSHGGEVASPCVRSSSS